MRFARKAAGIVALGVGVLAADALATSLQISPVLIEMPAHANAVGMTLTNPGDEPVYGQVRVYRWDQSVLDDTLEPTQEIVASPPLVKVPPHGEQLIRLIRPVREPVSVERSFRVLIDEIPQPGTVASDSITIRLRYSVPVFVQPPALAGAPVLSWQLKRAGEGWLLCATNSGERHGQVGEVTVVTDRGEQALNQGLLGYVLPGHERHWKVPLADASIRGPLRLRAKINGQSEEATVQVLPSE